MSQFSRQFDESSNSASVTAAFNVPMAKRIIPWLNDKGDETLRLSYDLKPNSIVVDLGGYKGQWSSDIFSKYCCFIHTLEPVPEHYEYIQKRFERNQKITPHCFGLSDETRRATVSIDQDRSSLLRQGQNCKEVLLVRADRFFEKNNLSRIDLMKINIEGAEYDLLDYLIESNLIKRIANIQVQFHDFVPDAERRMSLIHKRLQETHEIAWQYPLVWESWKIKSNTQTQIIDSYYEAIKRYPYNSSIYQALGKLLVSQDKEQQAKRAFSEFYKAEFRNYPKTPEVKNWIISGKPVPPPHLVKQQVIIELSRSHSIYTLIETGTYLGEMVSAQKDFFKAIYSIELSVPLYLKAQNKFSEYQHINLLQGDSSKVLPKIISSIKEPCLFWLDGHYSAGITAKGELCTPIWQELNTIFEHPIKNHVILIDDARDFDGSNDYPTLEQLKHFVYRHQPESSFEVRDDIIRIYPKVDPRVYQYPLFVSYPRTGSHWINSAMELYFDRPRLREQRITFLDASRADYAWFHDHDLSLKIVHDNTMYMYRNPVDVLYSYSLAELGEVNRDFIVWHTQNIKNHYIKYLLSNKRAQTVVKYENFLMDFKKEFSKIIDFFGYAYDSDRIDWVAKTVTKESLAAKGQAAKNQQYIGSQLLNQAYIESREVFREKYQDYIERHVIIDELKPFFE